ncbi:MAG: ribonuclease HI family protein [Acidobacteria bacterium]|nr:ribonuclease HI family protein [Acidobacteriota bacterium]
MDGGSRGNPGEAGWGVSIQGPDGAVFEEMYGYLGEATNNVAEYSALIALLEHAVRRGVRDLTVLSDSELLVRQVNGEYRVKHPALQELHVRALDLLDRVGRARVRHVPREENRRADRLARRAMNLRRTSGPHPPEEE